jgi:diguanylate cyclase (GGDEF)-like protein
MTILSFPFYLNTFTFIPLHKLFIPPAVSREFLVKAWVLRFSMRKTLEQILEIGSPRELRQCLGRTALLKADESSDSFLRSDIEDSCRQFLRSVYDAASLTFAGLYIDGSLDIRLEVDTGEVKYGRRDEFDPSKVVYVRPVLMPKEGTSTLVCPVRFRDVPSYGVAVFEKQDFSAEEVAVLRHVVFKLANHINNIGDKPELRRKAFTDALTGTYNRWKWKQDYPELLMRCKDRRQEVGVIFFDFDDFGKLNSTYGHIYADGVLREVGEIMQKTVREDTDMVYRYGGDEYVIVVPSASAAKTETIARRVADNIREHVFKGMGDLPPPEVTVSVGSVSSGEEGLESNDLVSIADMRMLRAKGYGKNIVVSNVAIDSHTGIASMPLFLPHLKSRLKQANRESGGNVGVVLFDIIGFGDFVRSKGSDLAWDLFKQVAKWFYDARNDFDYVARAYSRDQMVVSLVGAQKPEEFFVHVQGRVSDYVKRASSVAFRYGDKEYHFKFAAGGVVYSPVKHVCLLENPDVLFTSAENVSERASKAQSKIIIEDYC